MRNNRTQNLSDMTADDEQIAALLGGLNRVNAPADFDFRVKAGIARGTATSSGGFRLRRGFAYAAAIALLVVVGVPMAIFYANRSNGVESTNLAGNTQDAVAVHPVEAPPANGTGPNEVSGDRIATIREDKTVVTNANKTANSPDAIAAPRKTRGGSYVEASREGNRRLPKGLDPNARTPTKPEDFAMNAPISAKDVLSTLGVNAKFDGSAWTVEAVSENSVAARAGLRPGDMIEAIDDQALSADTEFKGKVSGKTIRIVRAGKPLSIDLSKP